MASLRHLGISRTRARPTVEIDQRNRYWFFELEHRRLLKRRSSDQVACTVIGAGRVSAVGPAVTISSSRSHPDITLAAIAAILAQRQRDSGSMRSAPRTMTPGTRRLNFP